MKSRKNDKQRDLHINAEIQASDLELTSKSSRSMRRYVMLVQPLLRSPTILTCFDFVASI